MIEIKTSRGVSLRVNNGTQWYVRPHTQVVNDFLAGVCHGDIAKLNVLNGPEDVSVWNVTFDKVNELVKRAQQGRIDIKFDLYRKLGHMIELIMQVNPTP